ncbi:class F sortase [Arthrobacter sp. YD2]|uniref:class F sortase n=1 Tax=Arthrobacter sp. YD2 TaxID=3058046 RepID=UPI0033B87A68
MSVKPFRRLAAAVYLSAAAAMGTAACGGTAMQPGPAPESIPATATEQPPAAPAPGATAPSTPVPVRPATQEPVESVPDPVSVSVEGTGIDLEVIPVGQEDNGAMTLPDNHYQAGWYRFGPAPGSTRGSAVLAAHVDSRTEQLPIADLDEVPAGTPLTVTRSDGSVLRYTTEKVENIPKASLGEFDLFNREGEARLKLVTCGGEWLDSVGDYEDNVVLTAVPVP